MTALREELPPLPDRIAKLPVDGRGYPVPWFVAWLDENREPIERGQGEPDFRIIHPEAVLEAITQQRCWICGSRLGAHRTFVIGPMCAVNRTSAEPPSHLDCGDFAARACPFLTRPHMRRNEKPKPDGLAEAPGIALMRNPGVALVWTTKSYRPRRDPNGFLFRIGEPEHVLWYAEGRPATRDEVCASIDSGLPALREIAEEGGATELQALDRAVKTAMELVPA